MSFNRFLATLAIVLATSHPMVRAADGANVMPESIKGSWVLNVGGTKQAMTADKTFSKRPAAEKTFLLTMYSKMEYTFSPGKMSLMNYGRKVEYGQRMELPLIFKSATKETIAFELVRKHGNGMLTVTMNDDRMVITMGKKGLLDVMVWMRKPKGWKAPVIDKNKVALDAAKAASESKKTASKKAAPAAK